MDTAHLISQVRDGQDAGSDALYEFGKLLTGNSISDAQAGAFAMAVRLKGLSSAARVGLTLGMRDSGDVLKWDLPGPILDKHSTGGVGDPVSLLLAPALAACGAFVPMISGRGLGHTGGTLDKLEAIPGYITDIGPKRLEHVLTKIGCAIIGATGRVAPSDKRLYAIRDVTGTVASTDLITASILSKKLAAGLDGLVLDVKTGSGAFMPDQKDALSLAETLVSVANQSGCKTSALVTDMSQPLANAAGNALEIKAVMAVLSGAEKTSRLLDVTCALGGQVLSQSSLAKTPAAGETKVRKAIETGHAMEVFAKMVAALGGPTDFETSWQFCLPEATVQREVLAGKSGFIQEVETTELGNTVVALGGGRLRETDKIDPAVGLSGIAPLGSKVTAKTTLAMVHASDEAQADRAADRVRKAFKIGAKPAKPLDLIQKVVTA